jgi:hypothetical protein
MIRRSSSSRSSDESWETMTGGALLSRSLTIGNASPDGRLARGCIDADGGDGADERALA